jgi:cell division protein FtsB
MQHLTPVALFCIAVMLLFFTVTGNHGVLQLQRINNELEAYDRKNGQLESDIHDVQTRISQLQHDDSALEKIAREELGLARRNETVYIFSNAKTEDRKR